MTPVLLKRLGMLMEPGNASEVEGVLDPAAGRGPNEDTYSETNCSEHSTLADTSPAHLETHPVRKKQLKEKVMA